MRTHVYESFIQSIRIGTPSRPSTTEFNSIGFQLKAMNVVKKFVRTQNICEMKNPFDCNSTCHDHQFRGTI